MKEFVIRKKEGGFEFAVYLCGCCLFSKWFSEFVEAELFADYYKETC